jgi:hypothetical protein
VILRILVAPTHWTKVQLLKYRYYGSVSVRVKIMPGRDVKDMSADSDSGWRSSGIPEHREVMASRSGNHEKMPDQVAVAQA